MFRLSGSPPDCAWHADESETPSRDRIGEARKLRPEAEVLADTATSHHRCERSATFGVGAVGRRSADRREERGEIGRGVVDDVVDAMGSVAHVEGALHRLRDVGVMTDGHALLRIEATHDRDDLLDVRIAVAVDERKTKDAHIEPLLLEERAFGGELDVPHVAIPHPQIDLVFRFGAAARGSVDAHAFGARPRVHRKTPRGVVRTVTARIRLGATEAILGVPAKEIAGRIVALDDLWGPAATRETFDRLAHAESTLESTKIVDSVLAERVMAARATPAGSILTLHAARKLVDTPVNAVADALGVSERHLRRVFLERTGLRPKTFAKLVRFRRAIEAARGERAAGWAEIAVTSGYYDQAHLIAEFRAIAGMTPRALVAELRTVASLG
jgi:AraC-like DNA-binding protein